VGVPGLYLGQDCTQVTYAVRLAVGAAVFASAIAACSSAQRVGTEPTTTLVTVAPTSTTNPESFQVTVPDCGAGAYRPTTLLITCANGGTMATGLKWTTWTPAGAKGTGTVHVQVSGQQQSGEANLELSNVSDNGTSGPQYTLLVVTWVGRSPDGHTSDSFQLGNGG
jgi:hypothetical protein